jgi:hypothetical protein
VLAETRKSARKGPKPRLKFARARPVVESARGSLRLDDSGEPLPAVEDRPRGIATFFPLISLIVALVLHDGERDPAKRGMLRNWALLSGGWIAVELLIGVVVFVAAW